MDMLISHRINTKRELADTPTQYGIEIDLRDAGDDIVLAHDPFCVGERFADFLDSYRHRFIILNIKSERIEWRVLELLKQHSIEDYFFLDCSFPMIYQLSLKGETRVAMRYSEFEGLESIRLACKKISWVWVDCFTQTPLTRATYTEIKEMGLKVCLVSPELQGQPENVALHIAYFQSEQICPDMVCSKLHHLTQWQTLFN